MLRKNAGKNKGNRWLRRMWTDPEDLAKPRTRCLHPAVRHWCFVMCYFTIVAASLSATFAAIALLSIDAPQTCVRYFLRFFGDGIDESILFPLRQ